MTKTEIFTYNTSKEFGKIYRKILPDIKDKYLTMELNLMELNGFISYIKSYPNEFIVVESENGECDSHVTIFDIFELKIFINNEENNTEKCYILRCE